MSDKEERTPIFGFKKLKFKGVRRIDKIEQRLDRIEAMFGDIFSLDLEQLKEKRDRAYDSLELPISDNAKNTINNEICKIERLISLAMKEGNSNGKNTQKES